MKRRIDDDDDIDKLEGALCGMHISKRARKMQYVGKFGIPFEDKPIYTHAEVETLIKQRDDILYEEYQTLMEDMAKLKERIHFLEMELALERRTCAIAFRTKEGI